MSALAGRVLQLADDIWTVDGALDPAECAAWITWGEAQGFEEAPVTTGHGPEMRKDIRNNSRVMADLPELAEGLWQRLRGVVPADWEGRAPVGVNERLRLYRYDPGQRFAAHFDGYFRRPTGEKSELTLMVYLNDGFEGGETTFYGSWRNYPDRPYVRAVPRRGRALLFRHHLLHEGTPVLSGRKYALRTDVMYGARQ